MQRLESSVQDDADRIHSCVILLAAVKASRDSAERKSILGKLSLHPTAAGVVDWLCSIGDRSVQAATLALLTEIAEDVVTVDAVQLHRLARFYLRCAYQGCTPSIVSDAVMQFCRCTTEPVLLRQWWFARANELLPTNEAHAAVHDVVSALQQSAGLDVLDVPREDSMAVRLSCENSAEWTGLFKSVVEAGLTKRVKSTPDSLQLLIRLCELQTAKRNMPFASHRDGALLHGSATCVQRHSPLLEPVLIHAQGFQRVAADVVGYGGSSSRDGCARHGMRTLHPIAMPVHGRVASLRLVSNGR